MAALGAGLSLGAAPVLRQNQEQTLSLLAQQRFHLLPMPVQRLSSELRQYAEQNPFLEYEPPARETSLEAITEPTLAKNDETGSLDYFNQSLEGFGDQMDLAAREEAERRHDWLVLSQTEQETLFRHLERQVLQTQAPGAQRELTLLVCDALDSDGYLRASVGELEADWWQACGGDPKLAEAGDVRQAIRTVQQLEPVGVGARSLAECLLLQVQADPMLDERRALRLRLCHHLGEVLTKPLERLARELGCSLDELREALVYLKTLNPFPGRAFMARENPECPEVAACLQPDGRWVAVCDERQFPLFRVDDAAIAEAKAAAKSREERACVAQLEGTLQRVAQAAFDRQGAFLDSGGDFGTLKPLFQREVAAAIGYDESIVSRAIKDKQVRVATSRKPIPLKAFFTRACLGSAGAVTGDGAEGVSDQQVKHALRALVSGEPPEQPLSDQALCEALAGQGIQVARRTVAKYREQLGIPSTRERRRLVGIGEPDTLAVKR